ncbi:MAG: hypothetical protein RLZZ470_1718 [Pseudomonadota bacterium]|jgi:uncharacterized protein
MKTDWHPQDLDLHRFTQLNGELSVATPLAALPRVLEVCLEPAKSGPSLCQWVLRGETRRLGGVEQAWMHLSAQLTLRQTCQRCLEAMDLAVQVDSWFRLVADEATALAEDDESEEDLLVMAPDMDALALLEDEILLALPLVPRHDACHAPLSAALEDDLPHPFAALAGLKLPRQ